MNNIFHNNIPDRHKIETNLYGRSMGEELFGRLSNEVDASLVTAPVRSSSLSYSLTADLERDWLVTVTDDVSGTTAGYRSLVAPPVTDVLTNVLWPLCETAEQLRS